MGFLDRWLKKSGPLDNRELERCMADLAQGDSIDKRRRLYAALRAARLMLATPGAEPQETPRVSDGTVQIRFVATRDREGKPAMLAFTSEDALRAWRPVGCMYTVLPAPDLFRLALKSRMETILINLSGPAGGFLTHREIVTLAEGLDPSESQLEIPGTTKIVIESPRAPLGEGILAALRAHADPRIEALFHVTATIGNGTPHALVGVDLAAGTDPRDAITGLMRVVQPAVREGDILDFVPLAGSPHGDEIRTKGTRLLSR